MMILRLIGKNLILTYAVFSIIIDWSWFLIEEMHFFESYDALWVWRILSSLLTYPVTYSGYMIVYGWHYHSVLNPLEHIVIISLNGLAVFIALNFLWRYVAAKIRSTKTWQYVAAKIRSKYLF